MHPNSTACSSFSPCGHFLWRVLHGGQRVPPATKTINSSMRECWWCFMKIYELFEMSDSLFVTEGELRDERPSLPVLWVAVSLQKNTSNDHKEAAFCAMNQWIVGVCSMNTHRMVLVHVRIEFGYQHVASVEVFHLSGKPGNCDVDGREKKHKLISAFVIGCMLLSYKKPKRSIKWFNKAWSLMSVRP